MSEFVPDDLAKAYIGLRDVGISLQRDGVEVVRIAESGIANTRAVWSVYKAGKLLAKEQPKYGTILDGITSTGQSTLVQINDSIEQFRNAGMMLVPAMFTASYAVTSSNVAIQQFAQNIDTVAYSPQPEIKAVLLEGALKKAFTDAQLESLLESFNKSYVERRRGAWQTFYSSSDDALAQASHSMRDILAGIVARDAANNFVEPCGWYQAKLASGKKKKVEMDDRVRYLLFGPADQGIDDPMLKVIETEVREYVDDDGALKKTAHGSKSFTREEIKLSMDRIEELLFLILKRAYGK